MTRLDDPALVAREYADDERLRRRASVFTHVGGGDVRDVVVERVTGRRRVLEVGCGWGELAARIAAGTGADVTATDLSPHMIALARERGLRAQVADVQALPFADASFDAAVAAWMLYHVPDLDRALAELARVLAPGGRLVAVTNSARHLQELRELVGSGPSPSTFTSENGRGLLERHFAAVEAVEHRGTVNYATRADVAGYVDASIAMSPFAGNLPERLDEPFVASTHVTVFVAETA